MNMCSSGSSNQIPSLGSPETSTRPYSSQSTPGSSTSSETEDSKALTEYDDVVDENRQSNCTVKKNDFWLNNEKGMERVSECYEGACVKTL